MSADNPPGESWRIRIKMSGLNIYVVSAIEPRVLRTPAEEGWRSDEYGNRLSDVIGLEYEAIPIYGDEIGYINWAEVQAISWRYHFEPDPE